MMSWLYKELAEDIACRCLLFEPTDAATAGVEVSGWLQTNLSGNLHKWGVIGGGSGGGGGQGGQSPPQNSMCGGYAPTIIHNGRQ